MKFRESELFYARLEGKFAAIDDERDNGRFYMNMRSEKAADSEYWNIFYDSYNEQMTIEDARCK
jgi:hypothetical protein